MKEGIGNIPIIGIIIVFIAFVSGYLAYNVNYTKAFRMKNRIISLYEEYGGKCNTDCENKIVAYAQEIGYSSYDLDDCKAYKPTGAVSYVLKDSGYCVYYVDAFGSGGTTGGVGDCTNSHYYHILTRIDIRVPIIEKVLKIRALNVTGDTRIFANSDCNAS